MSVLFSLKYWNRHMVESMLICHFHLYLPSLSYNLNASFNSACMASASSSTINLDAKVTNSANSNSPEPNQENIRSITNRLILRRTVPSSSTSAIISFSCFSVIWIPNILIMVPTIVVPMLPFFSTSNVSNAFFNTVRMRKTIFHKRNLFVRNKKFAV